MLEFHPLAWRSISPGGSKVLFQQGSECMPGSSKLWRQCDGLSQYILSFHTLAARADCRRYFCHMLGRAIGMGNLSNANSAHPPDGFVGSLRTPQRQEDISCAQ